MERGGLFLVLVVCAPPGCGRIVQPFEGITVRSPGRTVEIQAWVCGGDGPLRQVACSANTREHESLVVVRSRPGEVHAALLLAGYNPGAPGAWGGAPDHSFRPPTGDRILVRVRFTTVPNAVAEVPIGAWIADPVIGASLPDGPWVFGGSERVSLPRWMGGGDAYQADRTGSVIGLVTYGDEVLGFSRGYRDPGAAALPRWHVDRGAAPPLGTPVTLVLRPARGR